MNQPSWVHRMGRLILPTAQQQLNMMVVDICNCLGGFSLCAQQITTFRGGSSKWIHLILSGYTSPRHLHIAGMAYYQRSSMHHHEMNGFTSTGLLTVSWLSHLCVGIVGRSEEHTSELQSPCKLVCRLLL